MKVFSSVLLLLWPALAFGLIEEMIESKHYIALAIPKAAAHCYKFLGDRVFGNTKNPEEKPEDCQALIQHENTEEEDKKLITECRKSYQKDQSCTARWSDRIRNKAASQSLVKQASQRVYNAQEPLYRWIGGYTRAAVRAERRNPLAQLPVPAEDYIFDEYSTDFRMPGYEGWNDTDELRHSTLVAPTTPTVYRVHCPNSDNNERNLRKPRSQQQVILNFSPVRGKTAWTAFAWNLCQTTSLDVFTVRMRDLSSKLDDDKYPSTLQDAYLVFTELHLEFGYGRQNIIPVGTREGGLTVLLFMKFLHKYSIKHNMISPSKWILLNPVLQLKPIATTPLDPVGTDLTSFLSISFDKAAKLFDASPPPSELFIHWDQGSNLDTSCVEFANARIQDGLPTTVFPLSYNHFLRGQDYKLALSQEIYGRIHGFVHDLSEVSVFLDNGRHLRQFYKTRQKKPWKYDLFVQSRNEEKFNSKGKDFIANNILAQGGDLDLESGVVLYKQPFYRRVLPEAWQLAIDRLVFEILAPPDLRYTAIDHDEFRRMWAHKNLRTWIERVVLLMVNVVIPMPLEVIKAHLRRLKGWDVSRGHGVNTEIALISVGQFTEAVARGRPPRWLDNELALKCGFMPQFFRAFFVDPLLGIKEKSCTLDALPLEMFKHMEEIYAYSRNVKSVNVTVLWQSMFEGGNLHCRPRLNAKKERINPHEDEIVVMYLKGGGHMVGNAHWMLNPSMFSYLANIEVLAVSTRNTVSEETAYPASLIDAYTAWDYLTRVMGYSPKNIALMGDSAGGGLCHVLIMLLKKYGLETPGKVIFDSPMINADVSSSKESPYKHQPPDILSPRMIDWAWSVWTIIATPLRMTRFMSPGSKRNLIKPGDPEQKWDLKGYPDVLLMYGTGERFHNTGDFENFAASLEARDVKVVKHPMENMWHVPTYLPFRTTVEAFLVGAKFLRPGQELRFTRSFSVMVQIMHYMTRKLTAALEQTAGKVSEVHDVEVGIDELRKSIVEG